MSEYQDMWKDFTEGKKGAALSLLLYNIRQHAPNITADTINGVFIPMGLEGISGIEELDMGYYTGCIPWGDDTGSIACACLNRANETKDETLMLHARFALQAWVEWKIGLGEEVLG